MALDNTRLAYKTLVRISLSSLALSLFLCIVFGLYNGFSKVNYTRCGSYEVLPSVSAVIDYNGLHRAMWQVPIVLHCLQHLLQTMMSYRYYQSSSVRVSLHAIRSYSPWSGMLNLATAAVDLVSVTSLFMLSFFTSTLYFPVHKNSVIVFMVSATLHMVLSAYQYWLRSGRAASQLKDQPQHLKVKAAKSLRVKLICVCVNVIMVALGAYLYLHHSAYCKAYTYSLFALCEYVVIASILTYHYSVVWDLPPAHIALTYSDTIT